MALSRTTLVQRIRWELNAGLPPEWEDSSLSAASASSTITGATADFWVKGDVGEFLEDGDTFLTISLSGTTITATRSYDGSTGAAHTSVRVLKNPRYRFNTIVNAVESVIQERLWPRAYKSVADTITPDISDATPSTWYDLAATARGLIDVRQLYGSSDSKEGRYGVNRRAERRVELRQNMTTSLAASRVGVRFPDSFFHSTNTVNIDYAAKITDSVTGGSYDDITDGDAVVEAVIFGACAHLEESLESRKPRRPKQDRETLRGAALFERKFQRALDHAEQELRDTIPMMR